MRSPTPAPIFACLYPGLCEVARRHGYALAIHGSLTCDMDLVAIPWIEGAQSADVLRQKLMSHINACGYDDYLRINGSSEENISIVMSLEDHSELKPHGRRAWNLYLDAGVKIDLSIMPLIPATKNQG